MRIRHLLLIFICFISLPSYAQIEIRTRFSSFVGKPTWLLTVRDVESGESHPYLFDIRRGENYWVVPNYGYYLITISNVRINTYDAKYNRYKKYEIKNFCHLESRGRIIHGDSMLITIDGSLSKNSNDYRCKIQTW